MSNEKECPPLNVAISALQSFTPEERKDFSKTKLNQIEAIRKRLVKIRGN